MFQQPQPHVVELTVLYIYIFNLSRPIPSININKIDLGRHKTMVSSAVFFSITEIIEMGLYDVPMFIINNDN